MRSMSYRWIPIIATFLVMLIGHILSRVTLADYEKRAKKTAEFRDKFIDLANHYMEYHQVDPKLYQECIEKLMIYKQNWDTMALLRSSLTR